MPFCFHDISSSNCALLYGIIRCIYIYISHWHNLIEKTTAKVNYALSKHSCLCNLYFENTMIINTIDYKQKIKYKHILRDCLSRKFYEIHKTFFLIQKFLCITFMPPFEKEVTILLSNIVVLVFKKCCLLNILKILTPSLQFPNLVLFHLLVDN